MYYFSWIEENFVLQDAGNYGFQAGICTDFVRLQTQTTVQELTEGGAVFCDPLAPKTVCGDHPTLTETNSGARLRVRWHK